MSNPPDLNLIFGRRSVRVYSPGEIPEATITALLQAAMAAPSAMSKDPWRFIVARQPGTLRSLADALAGGKMLATATVAIIVCGDLNSALDQQLSFLLQDCSAATENLLLAAHALGLGGCWVGVHPDESALRRLKELFGLPQGVIPIAVISLGLPGESLPARTRFNREYVHLDKW
jgi:nitroreductase